MPVSLAATIPPELFANILGHVTVPSGTNRKDARAQAQRLMSTCARVCRYWSQVCRPRLFHSITLHSENDPDRLAALLEAPAAGGLDPIATLIHAIVAVPKLAKAQGDIPVFPWLHLIPLRILPKLPSRGKGVKWSIDVRLDYRLLALFLPLQGVLPRTMPPSRPAMTSLTIRNVHVDNTKALALVLSSIEGLQHLVCIDVLCDTSHCDAGDFCEMQLRSVCTLVSSACSDPAKCLTAPIFLRALVNPPPRRGRRALHRDAATMSPTEQTALQELLGFARLEGPVESGDSDGGGAQYRYHWEMYREHDRDSTNPTHGESVSSYCCTCRSDLLIPGTTRIVVKARRRDSPITRSIRVTLGPLPPHPTPIPLPPWVAARRASILVVRQLAIEVLKTDQVKIVADDWEKWAESVDQQLRFLERTVLVSKNPAYAQTVFEEHGFSALRVLHASHGLEVGTWSDFKSGMV